MRNLHQKLMGSVQVGLLESNLDRNLGVPFKFSILPPTLWCVLALFMANMLARWRGNRTGDQAGNGEEYEPHDDEFVVLEPWRAPEYVLPRMGLLQ